jgi:hypothetical protein
LTPGGKIRGRPPAGRHVDPAVLGQAAAKVGIEILGPPGTLPT